MQEAAEAYVVNLFEDPPQFKKEWIISKNKYSSLGISYLYTLLNAGNNCIPDDSGLLSANLKSSPSPIK